MEQSIKDTAAQFSFEPVIENENKLRPADGYVVGGMGGSHLAAGILKIIDPSLDMHVHRGYGLPGPNTPWFQNALYIASSYSGNTEETLDFAEKAVEQKYNLAIVSTGGRLIEFAKKNNVPYILLPHGDIQPRVALGFSLLALAKLTVGDEMVKEFQTLGSKLDAMRWKEVGEALAEELKTTIPIVYSSRVNTALAYSWKIKFNETAKIPAFYNVLPELNHNEMTGFDTAKGTKKLSKDFHFIFLEDSSDHPKIMRRMEVLKKVYEDRGHVVKLVSVVGDSQLEKVFNSLILADWTALTLAKAYGVEAQAVPMVEEFKKLIS